MCCVCGVFACVCVCVCVVPLCVYVRMCARPNAGGEGRCMCAPKAATDTPGTPTCGISISSHLT